MKEEFGFKYETNCDVEAILHLFGEGGIEHCARNLDGVFAFCILDSKNKRVYLARDPYGVRPLFRLFTKNGVLGICSEAKGGCPSELFLYRVSVVNVSFGFNKS